MININSNINDVIKRLDTFHREISTGSTKLNKKIASFMKQRAKKRAPFRMRIDGGVTLRQSIVQVDNKKSSSVFTTAPHALAVERGAIYPDWVFIPKKNSGKHGEGIMVRRSERPFGSSPKIRRTGFWSLSIADTVRALPKLEKEYLDEAARKAGYRRG